MTVSLIFRAATGGLICFAAQAMASLQNIPVKYISVPAYNIIADSLLSIAPQPKNDTDKFLLQQMCALARGDITRQQMLRQLATRNMTLNSDAAPSSLSGILAADQPDVMKTQCATYLISQLFSDVDMTQYFITQAPKSVVDGKAKAAQAEEALDQAGFVQDVRTQMAVAKATAQLFALIANNLDKKPMLWRDHQKKIQSITQVYAAEFLQAVRAFYTSQNTLTVSIDSLTRRGYRVHFSDHNQLTVDDSGLTLSSRGVLWLGEGKILGNDYFANVIIIAAVNNAKPAVEKKEKQG